MTGCFRTPFGWSATQKQSNRAAGDQYREVGFSAAMSPSSRITSNFPQPKFWTSTNAPRREE
jgi:hypothetical protein